MLIEIKDRWTGAILHCGEYEDVRACLLSAVKAPVRCASAHLRTSGEWLLVRGWRS